MIQHIVRRLLVAPGPGGGRGLARVRAAPQRAGRPGPPLPGRLRDRGPDRGRPRQGRARPAGARSVPPVARRIARGDLGTSLAQSNMSVGRLILERLPRTLEVASVSILLGLLIGMPIGVLAALRRGRPEDVGLTASSLLSLSIPAYVSGTVLVLIFAVWLRWLPASRVRELRRQPRPSHAVADPAVRDAGLPPGRQHRPADPLLGAGGHHPGLRAHRSQQGPLRARGAAAARGAEQPAAGHHHRRVPGWQPARRDGHRGGDLRLAGPEHPSVPGHPDPRFPGRPGLRAGGAARCSSSSRCWSTSSTGCSTHGSPREGTRDDLTADSRSHPSGRAVADSGSANRAEPACAAPSLARRGRSATHAWSSAAASSCCWC